MNDEGLNTLYIYTTPEDNFQVINLTKGNYFGIITPRNATAKLGGTTMRYAILDCQEANWMAVAVDKKITNKRWENFNADTALLSNLAGPLMELNGVVGVYLEKHLIYIKKGEVFQWSEIVPDVLAAIKSALAPNEILYKSVLKGLPSQVPIVDEELNFKKESPPDAINPP